MGAPGGFREVPGKFLETPGGTGGECRGCSWTFRGVPEGGCVGSGMVPGFTDTPKKVKIKYLLLLRTYREKSKVSFKKRIL